MGVHSIFVGGGREGPRDGGNFIYSTRLWNWGSAPRD